MEDCEESGSGKEKERNLWTGFPLGSAIFITRPRDQGPPCLPGRAAQPSNSWECTSPGGLGAPTTQGRPLQGRLLGEGAEKVKRKKEHTSSLGPSFLACSHGTVVDGNTDVPTDSGGPGLLSPLQLRALPHPLPLLPGTQPSEDFRQGMASVFNAASFPNGTEFCLKVYTQPLPAPSPGLGTWPLLQKPLLKKCSHSSFRHH